MDTAGKEDFRELSIILPCCKMKGSLNDLTYHFPCGFACVEFDIWNPVTRLCDKDLTVIEGLLGTSVRLINSHL